MTTKHNKMQLRRTLPEERSANVARVPFVAVRGAIQPRLEMKYVDTTIASGVLDTTGSITLINGISEGDDNTNRNSRSVLIKSVEVRGSAQPTATTGLPQKCRLLLVWDNAANGVAPAIADILTAVSPYAYPNVNFERRFTILWDWSFVLGLQAAAVADQVIVNYDTQLRLNSLVQFQGTGGTVASIQNGAMYFVSVGGNAAGTTAGTTTCVTRVRFLESDSA